MGWTGHALTVGVTGPELDHAPGEEPRHLGPPPISNARGYAADLFGALEDFGYVNGREAESGKDPGTSGDLLKEAVNGAISRARTSEASALINSTCSPMRRRRMARC